MQSTVERLPALEVHAFEVFHLNTKQTLQHRPAMQSLWIQGRYEPERASMKRG